MRDICEYLGGREDKDFLGSGNLGLVIQPQGTRLLFLQRWQDSGLVDWAAGSIRAWAPDRIELVEPLPGSGLHCSSPPARRWVFMAREDVLGMTLEWVNDSLHELVVQVELSGRLPGLITSGGSVEPWLAYAQAVYSERVTQPVFMRSERQVSLVTKSACVLDLIAMTGCYGGRLGMEIALCARSY